MSGTNTSSSSSSFHKTEGTPPESSDHADNFDAWRAASKVRLVYEGTPQFEKHKSQLEALTQKFQLPAGIRNLETNNAIPGHDELLGQIKAWAKTHPQEEDAQDDPFHMVFWWSTLLYICKQTRIDVAENSLKANRRTPVDVLFALVFQDMATPEQLMLRSEYKFRLCAVPDGTSNQPNMNATADTLVLQSIGPTTWDQLTLLKEDNKHYHPVDFCWSPQGELPHTTIAFAGEFRSKPNTQNENQLIFDLTTAQRHREWCGLPITPVFGATYAAGKVQVFVSSLEEDDDAKLPIYVTSHPEGLFDLQKPVDVLKCYSFLCELRDQLSDAHDILQAENARLITLRTGPSWRSSYEGPKGNDAYNHHSKRRRTSTSDHSHRLSSKSLKLLESSVGEAEPREEVLVKPWVESLDRVGVELDVPEDINPGRCHGPSRRSAPVWR